MRLVFVGADDGGPYRQTLADTARRCNVGRTMFNTGFVDAATYRLYLQSTDIAVQLRADSRGESSRTVLDCLAYGVPTIVNAYASLADHSRRAVLALHCEPSRDELADALRQLAGHETLRHEYSVTSRDEVAIRHSPALVAAQYRDVIDKAMRDDERSVVEAIGLARRGRNGLDSATLARAIQANDQVRQFPRLLIDVTRIASSDLHSGIERVISCLVRGFAMHAATSLNLELFRLEDGLPIRAFRYAERVFSLSPGSLGTEVEITVRPGDRVLMLDSSWNDFGKFSDLFAKVRAGGGTVTGVVYDLIPIRFPRYCHEHVLSVFDDWLESMTKQSDRIICISRSVATDLEKYLDERAIPPAQRPFVTFAHLDQISVRKPTMERSIPSFQSLSTALVQFL